MDASLHRLLQMSSRAVGQETIYSIQTESGKQGQNQLTSTSQTTEQKYKH